MRKLSVLLLLGITVAVIACKKQVAKSSGGSVYYLDVPANGTDYFGPANAEMNHKATLGRVLFYERGLSINNSVACASCHKQEFAFSDNTALSRGFENRLTSRNSMAIQNLSAFGFIVGPGPGPGPGMQGRFFWDGRESSLQQLVARPITNHVEMGIEELDVIPQKLAAYPYYKDMFRKAFGTEDITMDRIGEAMSLFMTSITAQNTRFDQALNGKLELSGLEAEGRRLFNTKYECSGCHQLFPGAYGGGTEFINIGLDYPNTDKGAGGVMRDASWNGRFKIPNLRNVARTAPYMHDGRFATLEDVLDHYSHGIANDPNLDTRLRDEQGAPIRMNISANEKQALIAFLHTLTDHQMLTDERFSNPFRVK